MLHILHSLSHKCECQSSKRWLQVMTAGRGNVGQLCQWVGSEIWVGSTENQANSIPLLVPGLPRHC